MTHGWYFGTLLLIKRKSRWETILAYNLGTCIKIFRHNFVCSTTCFSKLFLIYSKKSQSHLFYGQVYLKCPKRCANKGALSSSVGKKHFDCDILKAFILGDGTLVRLSLTTRHLQHKTNLNIFYDNIHMHTLGFGFIKYSSSVKWNISFQANKHKVYIQEISVAKFNS